MKKVLIALGGFVFLILVAMIVIPLVVDVDRYRPQIVSKANEKLNGQLELGKLSLSLWGQIRVQVDGVDLKDSTGTSVLSVKEAYFHIPFSSVISGAPLLTLKMQSPRVNVIKNAAGKLNVLTLMKEEAKGEGQSTPATGSAPTTGPATTLPGIVANARLGAELRNAVVTYKDQTTGLDSQIKDLNLILKDMSLSRPTAIELWADLDTKMGKTLALKGPIRLTGTAKPEMAGGKLGQVSLQAKFEFDELEMSAQSMFHKKKGVPANINLSVIASDREAKIESLAAKFFNLDLSATGTVSNLGGSPAAASPVVNLHLQSNEVELKPWVELIPMLKEYELGGTIRLNADANGPADKLGYRAKIALQGMTAKAPKIKGPPRIDGTVDISTDRVDNLTLTMKAPGTDLAIRGKVVSFAKPQIDLSVESPGIDLDQLVDLPPPGQTPAAGAPSDAKSEASAGAGGNGEDLDAMLNPLRENKSASETAANVAVNIKALKVYGIRIADLGGRLTYRDLVLGLERFGMKLWGGSFETTSSVQMKPKTPTYRFNAQVANLDLQQAVTSQLQLFKNTVLGKANFQISGEGSSFNSAPAKANLNARGKLKVTQATFASVDVGKMASEALNKGIERVGERIPQVKGKTVGIPSGRTTKYDEISSDFTIAGGKFSAPNFTAKAVQNDGIDLKGDTVVGLADLSLKTSWELIDTYNLTKAHDLNVEANGVRVDHILAEGNNPVRFPVHAGCTISAPCYSYTEVPEHLAKVALSNVSSAVQGKAKEELKNKAQSIIQKAPPAIQNPLNDLKNRLFH